MGSSKAIRHPQASPIVDCTMDPSHKSSARVEVQLGQVGVGEVFDVKDVYATSESLCDCCVTWDEVKPFGRDLEEVQMAKKERDAYAIVCGRHPHAGETWRTQLIWINNTDLKSALSDVFEGYPSVDCESPELCFERPFVPFVHRWQKFLQTEADEMDLALRENLGLLRQVLESEMEDTFRDLKVFEDTGYISFDNLKLAFVPGEVVMHTQGEITAGLLRGIKLITSTDNKDVCYRFKINHVDWDGLSCGVKVRPLDLEHFDGTRRLVDMAIVPMRCHPDSQSITDRLIARGRKFESLRGQHYMSYNGRLGQMYHTQNHLDWDEDSKIALRERVMIDGGYVHDEERSAPLPLDPLDSLTSADAIRKDNARSNVHGNYTRDGDFRHIQPERYYPKNVGEPDLTPLTDEQCMLAVPTVSAFAMESKLWCRLNIDSIEEITWNSNAVDKLVLKEAEKKLVLGFVSANQSVRFDDFVPGKGKGLIMLLCGPPGTGKTFTAETVSEHLERPLYRLDVSDLGTSVGDVERRLKSALARCARWNAVLLIDEADVFLEARSTDSLVRNQMVSVFLRHLEYYSGVMILTTNRSLSIDPAFESRVDITLGFSELDEAARAQIWRNFLEKDEGNESLGDDAVAILATMILNGRQIKSAVKTARVLAASEKVPLSVDHIRVVVDLRNKASRLLKGGVHSQ
ncbi:hypothetical protein AK830_g7464 [Neonectria ditissima]|uniref:AAA+ ATPase domain-containing protein n=1 Tax=Neonectria ditissima TaxID=78410 RepID=A0A0P7BFC4_9HYPO|nr:hypothetical protein AK830_g7464 [Neonectria ditissima]